MSRKHKPSVPTVTGLSVLAVAFLLVPLIGLLISAPWPDMLSTLSSPNALQALRLSIITSVSAAALAAMLGIPLAWTLARQHFPGKRLLRGIVLLPLVLPPVVGGVALLTAFGRRGLVGKYLYDWFGIQLPFTTAGVVLAEAFVALPFLVITVEGALRALDTRFEIGRAHV